ncbi:NUDIX hydrolase [Patescibacteria group bacterium]|nr:NUDIX hydrolase [Patescibacteria group bacterium]
MTNIAGVLICQNGKYLLVQENKPDDTGWTIPAGRVKSSESPEQGAIREGREETGLNLRIEYHVKTFEFDNLNSTVYIYRAVPIGGKLKINTAECIGLGWFSWKELKNLELRREFIRTAIKADIAKNEVTKNES